MNIVGGVLVVVHIIGWAIVLGGALVNVRTGVIAKGMLHGALTALVAGLIALVLQASGVLDWGPVIWPKMLTKLAVTVVICALVWWGDRKRTPGTPFVAAVGGLTVLNVFVAVLWR